MVFGGVADCRAVEPPNRRTTEPPNLGELIRSAELTSKPKPQLFGGLTPPRKG
jgi:hypothetical protein